MDESERGIDQRVRTSMRELVEFPQAGAYTLGFVTTETPVQLSGPAGHAEMLTLLLAPNPVMGGQLVHMPANKVMDVDMTVEEGIRTVVISGVDSDHAHVTLAEQADRYDRERDATENRPAEVADRDIEERAGTKIQPADVSTGASGSVDAGTEDRAEPIGGTPTDVEKR